MASERAVPQFSSAVMKTAKANTAQKILEQSQEGAHHLLSLPPFSRCDQVPSIRRDQGRAGRRVPKAESPSNLIRKLAVTIRKSIQDQIRDMNSSELGLEMSVPRIY